MPRSVDRGLLLLLALSLGLKLLLLIPASHTVPFADAIAYWEAAGGWLQGGEYQSLRAPGYPATIYVARKTTNELKRQGWFPDTTRRELAFSLIRLIGVATSTASVVIAWLLAIELFGRDRAFWPTAFFAFFPELVVYSHLLWGETQFIFFNLLWLWLLVRGTHLGSAKLVGAAGVAFACAALTRQMILNFLPVAVLWILWVAVPGKRVKLAIALSAVAVLTVAPWTIRNYVVHDAFIPVAPNMGSAFLFGASTDFFGDRQKAGHTKETHGLERDTANMRRAMELIQGDPLRYARLCVTRNLPGLFDIGSMIQSHLRTDPDEQVYRSYPPVSKPTARALMVMSVASYLLVLALGILGLLAAPRWKEALLVGAIILHGCALHTLASGFHRHRLYFMAFIVLYAGFFASHRPSEWLQMLRPSPRPWLLAATIAAATILIVVGEKHIFWGRFWLQWFRLGL